MKIQTEARPYKPKTFGDVIGEVFLDPNSGYLYLVVEAYYDPKHGASTVNLSQNRISGTTDKTNLIPMNWRHTPDATLVVK